MTLRRLFKLNAKRAMIGSWSGAMALVLILNSITLFFAVLQMFVITLMNIPFFIDTMGAPMDFADDILNMSPSLQVVVAVLGISYILVLSPLKLGINMWFYQLGGNGENDDISSIFFCFSERKLFFKSILLNVLIRIKQFICLLTALLPGSAIIAYSLSFGKIAQGSKENFLTSATFLIGIIILILSLVFAFIYCLKFFAVPYAFVNEDFKSIKSAFKISCRAVKGKRGELFMLFLSMAGFYIMNVFILTSFYSFPYTNAVKALYARYILQRAEYENEQPNKQGSTC